MAIREGNDDEGVLRTDGSVDQTKAYQQAEREFDPNSSPSTLPQNTGTVKKGGTGTSGDKQSDQMRTDTGEDPSKAASDADPTDWNALQ